MNIYINIYIYIGEVRVIPTPIRVIATTLWFKGVYINSELWNVCVDTY